MPSLTYRTWRAKHEAKRAARGPVATVLARAGLTARGVIYILIGLVAILVAVGQSGKEADQAGALKLVASTPFGLFALWLLGLGFAAYALWRLSEAAFGVTGEGYGAGPRLKSAARAVIYLGFAVLTFDIIAGTGGSQAKREQDWSAKAMHYPGGRWLVGAIGLAVVIAGLVLVVEGVRAKFMRLLETSRMSPRTRTVVKRLGMIGTTARGAVFAGTATQNVMRMFFPAQSRRICSAIDCAVSGRISRPQSGQNARATRGQSNFR